MPRQLFVHMLGNFSIELENKKLEMAGSIFSKTMHLFFLILLHGEEGIERRKAMELLYQDEDKDSDNDYGRFRVLVYRLKKRLTAAGLMKEDEGFHEKGMFRWQPEDLNIQIDVKLFEETANRALKNKNKDEEELLARACRLYRGEFLEALTSESWVAQKQVYYQELYSRCVRRYLELLQCKERYETMLLVAKKASRLYPYEEWYIGQMDALMGMGHFKQALEISEEWEKKMMDQMGLHPSVPFQERIKKINMQIKGSSKNLLEIRRDLEEKGNPQGGFFCNYPTFAWAYRYEIRRTERDGLSHYLILCSLTDKLEEMVLQEENEDFERVMADLGKSIAISLRRTDIYTRYSKNQYLMLMIQLKLEDCSLIIHRIEHKFRKTPGTGRFKLHYFYAPVMQDVQDVSAIRDARKFSPIAKEL